MNLDYTMSFQVKSFSSCCLRYCWYYFRYMGLFLGISVVFYFYFSNFLMSFSLNGYSLEKIFFGLIYVFGAFSIVGILGIILFFILIPIFIFKYAVLALKKVFENNIVLLEEDKTIFIFSIGFLFPVLFYGIVYYLCSLLFGSEYMLLFFILCLIYILIHIFRVFRHYKTIIPFVNNGVR